MKSDSTLNKSSKQRERGGASSVGGFVRKVDELADLILDRIIKGQYKIGAFMPKESDLALEMGVGRSAVREAVKLLEVHGLLLPKKRAGTKIQDPLSTTSSYVLRRLVSPSHGNLDYFASFLEVRKELECLIVKLAAQRRTEEDIKMLKEAFDLLKDSVDSPKDYLIHTVEMNVQYAKCTHNQVLVMLARWQCDVMLKEAQIFEKTSMDLGLHCEGVGMLVQAIIQGAPEVETSLRSYHEWVTPSLLSEAAHIAKKA